MGRWADMAAAGAPGRHCPDRSESLMLRLTVVRRFLAAAAFIGASLLSAVPARADLGAAESGPRQELSGRKYEAWCGTKENIDCIVEFTDGRMIVDGGKGIGLDQLKRVLYSEKLHKDMAGFGPKGAPCQWLGMGPKHCQVYFEFEYAALDGSTRWGTIRFMNRFISPGFRADVEAWMGEPLRAIGPSVKLTQ